MNNKLRKILISATIAGIYAALTLAFMPISFGPVNFRISEALTLLPFFSPYAVAGVTVGCLISNLLSPYGIIDMIFGTSATFIAALLTYYIGKSNLKFKRLLAPLPPVIVNAVVVGVLINLTLLKGPSGGITSISLNKEALLSTMFMVGLGEFIVCYFVGLPLIWGLEKNKRIREYL
ncbi:MAG: QueT transporter family protein [Bacillota bacterium]|nr:QueT transporter family protein [Bacillota bacterium]